MRTFLFSVLGVVVLSLPSHAKSAASGSGGPKTSAVPDPALIAAKPFDRNLNGRIDGEEIDALRQFFNAHPDSALKKYDVNKDGKLDDVEISAIKFPTIDVNAKPKKKSSSMLK